MTHFRQPRIGPDRRVRDRRSPPTGTALPEGPERRGPSRAVLGVGGVEGGELAGVRFRFAAAGPTLGAAEIAAGDDLLDRALAPRNFRAGALPPGAKRATTPLPWFGPAS